MLSLKTSMGYAILEIKMKKMTTDLAHVYRYKIQLKYSRNLWLAF